MKKLLFILVVLNAGFSKEPINLETLVKRDDVAYTKDTNKPYTGAVFHLNKSGEKRFEGYLKDGEGEGKWTWYHENGQISSEGNFKDGKKDGIWTAYNRDGSNDRVAKWKDGKKVK